MRKFTALVVSLVPAFAIACSTPRAGGPGSEPTTERAGPDTSPETERAGPDAKPETERAGPDTKPETEAAGPSVKLNTTRTGPKTGAFGPSNINYSEKTPKTTSLVMIDSRVAQQCGIGAREVYFAHDSAKLSPEAKEKLDKVANCMEKGKLAKMKIAVVGFTDPQGTEDHNEELGLDRAQSVVTALNDCGVDRSRLEAISGGETGSEQDQSGWPRARHVAIVPYEIASN